MNLLHPLRLCGAVEKVATPDGDSPGIIIYDVNGTKQTIPFSAGGVTGAAPVQGDQVEFQISESRRNGTKTGVSVKVLPRAVPDAPPAQRRQGYIAAIKDHYGFIETAEHDREIFFHFSALEEELKHVELGDEVEYTETRKNDKMAAERVVKLEAGSVNPEDVAEERLSGRVLRAMRTANTDQPEYAGLVATLTSDGEQMEEEYEFGITGLQDKKEFLQPGDSVTFQVATVRGTGAQRAVRIEVQRQVETAKVDSVKGAFGFLNFEVEGTGKKLFFHMSEVQEHADIAPGDDVQFVVVHNQRSGKYSAASLRKVVGEVAPARPRPERLVSRLKSVGQEGAPYVALVREPRRPDGTVGFSEPRQAWCPVQA